MRGLNMLKNAQSSICAYGCAISDSGCKISYTQISKTEVKQQAAPAKVAKIEVEQACKSD